MREIKVETVRNSEVYVKLKIGPISFQTPRRLIEGEWGDTFDFRINMHAHLFYTIQVLEIYFEELYFVPRLMFTSIGCCWHLLILGGLRLDLPNLTPCPDLPPCRHAYFILFIRTRWYNLRHRKNCYIHLHELKIRGPELEEDLTGTIKLEINYEPQEENSPVIRFLLSENLNVSAVTLTDVVDASDEEEPVVNTNRRFDPAVATEAAESRALGQPEVISLFKRFLGYVMTNEEYFAIKNFLDMATAWGQGMEVSNTALFIGFIILQKYYKSVPMIFGNNLALKKKDLDLPRVMYKYTMATMGWRGLSFYGKGQGFIADSLRSEADLRAVLQFLNMAKSDLLIFELGESRIFRPNFFVAIDKGLSAVILSIRGTMSLSDSITDFACEYIKYRGGMVHSGFFEAARWFMENICHQLIIFAKEYGLENIFICGHSLGGSTSAITTILLVDELKKRGNWPKTAQGDPINIHCYSYAPAPIITRDLCEDYLEFIDVFIYGDDIVPRMSYGSIIDFQIFIVYAAEVGKASHVFKGSLSERVFQLIDKCRVAILSQDPQMNLKLYIPGRIHHLLKLKAPNDSRFTVIDSCTCDRFVEFHISRKMLQHHMPDKYERALEAAYMLLVEDEVERMIDPEAQTLKTIISQCQSPDNSSIQSDQTDNKILN